MYNEGGQKARKTKEETKMWHEGTIGSPIGRKDTQVAHFWVKTSEEADETYGINGGKIIKMQIKIDGKTVVNYDRGWDIEPDENDEMILIAYSILLNDYN